MVKISYKGEQREFEKGIKIYEAFKDEIKESKKTRSYIACIYNNEVKSLGHRLDADGEIQLLDLSSDEGKVVYIRGLLYIMSKAVHELYPDAYLTINYQLSNAMFAEFTNMRVTENIVHDIQKKMEDIVSRDLEIVHQKLDKEEAKKMIESDNTLRGRVQLDNDNLEKVRLYFCEDYYNYFLGVMPLSTEFAKIFSVEKYATGFIIRYPDNLDPDVLQPFENNKKLLRALQEYEEIYKVLEVDTVYKYNKKLKQDPVDLICLSESLHEKKIADLASDITKRDNVKIILIAGPSSSGKTTFANKLSTALRLYGKKPFIISVDNYFVEREENPVDEHGNYDFERLEAIDLKLFNDHLKKLINGEEIIMPLFDFTTGHKSFPEERKTKLEKDQILVIEGIHCLNDKLTYDIEQKYKYKVFISDLTVLNIDYFNRISTTDTRLLRRMVRDHQFRGYSAEHTLKGWYSVRRGEKHNIFPYQETADYMFNSSIIYELSALKKYAIPLLQEIPNTMKEYSEAKRLLDLLTYFADIDESLIPNNSLIREFIGGSIYYKDN